MLHLWKKILKKSLLMIKTIEKLGTIDILQVNIGAAHCICNLKFNVPNEIPVVFHICSNYDYRFIMKEIANELEGQFQCLGENTEKYKNFSILIEKEVTNIDKNGNDSVVTTSYNVKCIDNARFMATLLSNLVDTLTEGVNKIKCKECDYSLEYENAKDNLIK